MKLVYDGWHKISKIKARIKGREVERELLHLKSAVGAIVTDSDGKIGLVEQYRPTVDLVTLEIPAGVLDKEGLTPLETIFEELEEECNIKRSQIIEATPCNPNGFYMVTGSSNAYMYMYRITVEVQPEEVLVDDADVERTIWVDFDTFEKMVLSGKIIDNKTIMSYFILKGEK